MAKIKICGLTREEDIVIVNMLKPDYIGFILTNGYRRSLDFDTARKLKNRLADGIKAVGVFVDENEDIVNACIKMGVIDIVQLHGNESASYCRKIDAPVIKVFKPDDFGKIKEYEDAADYFMFDSGAGSGKTFDWQQIPKTDKPFFLAGGIDEHNISQATEKVNPYCIDVSSSVETDGNKDYNKIKQIMEFRED